LNRIIIAREENIPSEDVYEEEKKVIKAHISKSSKFKVYIHPKFSRDIPDTSELKLIILDKSKPDKEFLEKCGEIPRVYKNTLIFLCQDENQKESFYLYLRKLIALKSIDSDKNLKLTENQRKEVKNKLKNYDQKEYEELRKLYRKVFLPAKDEYKEIDIGRTTFGESAIDKEIYEILRNQGQILEKIAPKVIKHKYLAGKDYIEVKKLYEAFLKTPGEIRLISKEGFIESIKEGVKNGLFGFGYVNGEEIKCECIKEIPSVNLIEGEAIIKTELCEKEQEQKEPESTETIYTQEVKSESLKVQNEQEGGTFVSEPKKYTQLSLKLKVPVGQISTIARVVNYLKRRFNQCDIEITIRASNGGIQFVEYDDKVMEALNQAGIKIVEEEKKLKE